MKTTIIKSSIALVALFLILIFTSAFNSPGESGNYLTMQVCSGQGGFAKIIVIYEDGKAEESELPNLKPGNITEIYTKVNQTLNSISKKGYTLQAVCGGDYFSTYTFLKK
ncbi:MAG: hypothetical protein MUF75_03265 [Bacteroidia bacterium]|jgi:hypothetical protein|nr:hypothetical protein [Bacteroidia bacterium]